MNQKKKDKARLDSKNCQDKLYDPETYKIKKKLHVQKYRLGVNKRLTQAYAINGDKQDP